MPQPRQRRHLTSPALTCWVGVRFLESSPFRTTRRRVGAVPAGLTISCDLTPDLRPGLFKFHRFAAVAFVNANSLPDLLVAENRSASRELGYLTAAYAAPLRAPFACSARLLKAAASFTARSARILRSSSTPAVFRPWMNWL